MRHPRLDRLMSRAGGRRRTAGRRPGTPGTGSGAGPTRPHAPRLSRPLVAGPSGCYPPPIASMIPIAASPRRAGRLIAVKLIGSVTGILGSRLSSRSNFRANRARRFSEKLNRCRDMVRSFPWQRNLRNAHPCRGRDWSGDLIPEPGTNGAATEGRPAALGLREGITGSWRLRFRERGELKTTGLTDNLARRHACGQDNCGPKNAVLPIRADCDHRRAPMQDENCDFLKLQEHF